jgi:DNA-binding transcriptional ArsR family regulator
LSYATVRQIAESTDLNPSTVRSLIKKLRQLGAIIESEQMWGTSAEEDIDGFDLVSADEAERRLHADIGAGPLGLLHKLNPESRSRIMSTSAGEQLTLQFPPFEKTFLIVRSHLREKVHR